jgi:transposase-like protein
MRVKWQNLLLQPFYSIAHLDRIVPKSVNKGREGNKSMHFSPGINLEGYKKLLE